MKKTLTKDITRYDDKMKLRFDAKTFKAMGISLLITAPVFVLLYLLASAIPAVMVSLLLLCGLMVLQIGTVQGMTMSDYIVALLKFAFVPALRKKPYSRAGSHTYSRITILTEAEEKHEKRQNAEKDG